ncbi:hypothetical protein [Rubrivivax gelatinosus]|uniref:hypothetical protein n=1 Tax=Rubrivivax gelatinosus TaxID=28068 RepID=UPI0005C183B8|nr:hypothetical protein [Rubrivivax gelatinosus]MBG6083211.1 hypothetical protein [Rubrivivax gelatinosus]
MLTAPLNQTNTETTAVDIGLSCLGCIDEFGVECQFFQGGACSEGRAAGCMHAAMECHAEAQAEIVLATITVMARHATSASELRARLPEIERVIELTAA